ncbi:uncharacterized protein LOC119301259 [Triticum dicoccoides]|uniref:uncharacterized protein LOC119301259 n=1 Tax=Triticum dicoccoides TaxID=85692 RepID=UPI0003D50763|nr:uncharacterized protein LOC119301259 [Triticum dicoccoides]XP_044380998.1 uncharacterized protein LOC123103467 isoform X1 [Triticum aestivum]
MEEMSARKRNNQHLLPNEENGNNPPKRKKDVSNEDNLQLFVKFLSELNDTQKNIVRKLGFASLLRISCACNIDDIFMWLALQFNTATCTLELRNGFNFEFNTSIVHKILGIPAGGLPINSTPTKECVDIINNFVQSSAPTIEHLIAMITDNISEENFSTIFLLLAISSLIAPNAKGSPSKKFYSALQNISYAGKYNWCLSTLSYLVHQIKKIKSGHHQKKAFYPGGCKLILVVAHFEFLITSEFKFPIDILPRLPLWSSSLLKTFTALDTMHGVHLQFGRLPLKHISSTPFNNISNEGINKLPTCILQYISSKFPSIYNLQEKALLEDMTKKFWQTIISNSIPTTERYIDDLHSTISKSFTHINNEMTESANEQITSPNNHISLHQQAEQIYSNKYFKDPTTFLSSHDFLDFAMPYSNPPNWEKEDGDSSIQWLDKKFSQCLLLENSSGIDDLFQKRSPTFEDLFVIDKINKQYDYPDIDFLQVLKDYIYTHTEANGMQETDKIDCTKEKFCLTQMKFVRPNHNCRDSKLYCLQQGTDSTTTVALDVSRNMKCSQSAPPTRSFPTTQNYNLGSTSNACEPQNSDIDIPSFTAITDSLKFSPYARSPKQLPSKLFTS